MSDLERRSLERAIAAGDPDARAKLEQLDRRAPPPELEDFDRQLRELVGAVRDPVELDFPMPMTWALAFVPHPPTRVVVLRDRDDLLIAKVDRDMANDIAAAMLQVAGASLSVVPGAANDIVRDRVLLAPHIRASVAIFERWRAWSST